MSCQRCGCSQCDPHCPKPSSQLYSDAAAHNGEAFCAAEFATNRKSHYDSRSAYASSNNSSDSADCDAQRCTDRGSNLCWILRGLPRLQHQQRRNELCAVWRDGERGADFHGVHVQILLSRRLLQGPDHAARVHSGRDRGSVRRHGHGLASSCFVHLGKRCLRAGAVHGACRNSDADISDSGGLLGIVYVLGDGCGSWSGRAARDIRSYGAHAVPNGCANHSPSHN